MFDDLDLGETGNADELPQLANWISRRYDEKLDDAIRSDEARQAALDSGYPDFWQPLEDWRLD